MFELVDELVDERQVGRRIDVALENHILWMVAMVVVHSAELAQMVAVRDEPERMVVAHSVGLEDR